MSLRSGRPTWAASVDRRTGTQQMGDLSSDMKSTSPLPTTTTFYHVRPGNIGDPAASGGRRRTSAATIVSRRQRSPEYDDYRRERYRTDVRATLDRRIGDESNERYVPRRETSRYSDEYYEIIPREIRTHRRSRSEDGDNTLSAVVDRRTIDAPSRGLPTAFKPRERSLSPDDDNDDDKFTHQICAAVVGRTEQKSKNNRNPCQPSAVVTKPEQELEDYYNDRPRQQSAAVDRAKWGTDNNNPSNQQEAVIARSDPPSKASLKISKPRYFSKSARKGRSNLGDWKSAEVFQVRSVALERTDTGAAAVRPQDRSRALEENNDRGLCLFCGMGRKSKGLSGGLQDQIHPRTLRSLPPPTRSRIIID